MKLLLKVVCAIMLGTALGTSAQIQNTWPPEGLTFLEGPANCSIFMGGQDRAGDGADGAYGESLINALAAFGEPSAFAIETIRNACARRLAQPEPRREEVR